MLVFFLGQPLTDQHVSLLISCQVSWHMYTFVKAVYHWLCLSTGVFGYAPCNAVSKLLFLKHILQMGIYIRIPVVSTLDSRSTAV